MMRLAEGWLLAVSCIERQVARALTTPLVAWRSLEVTRSDGLRDFTREVE